MISLAILSILSGAVLGMRFRVFVLVPVIGLAWLLLLTIGLGTDAGNWLILAAMGIVAASAQIGFLCGNLDANGCRCSTLGATRQ